MGDSIQDELKELFARPPGGEISPDIMGELRSMLRLHSISAQELFYKWESYSLKMGAEDTGMDLKTARAFKTDLQESLERESRSRTQMRTAGAEKRSGGGVTATARNLNKNMNVGHDGDMFAMLDGLVPNTPRVRETKAVNGSSSLKRKPGYETPAISSKTSRPLETPSHHSTTKPNGLLFAESENNKYTSFADRPNAGQIIETLNEHLSCPEPPVAPPAEARVKVMANTDLKKFSYRPMAMHLSEASEVLDDRIDEFTSLIQTHYNLPDSAFGNAAGQNTNEIIAVGRIASDSLEGRLNVASLVLETSRRVGAGLRVPLKVDQISSFEFFPGQIVALRGVNASGDYFTVKEIHDMPLLPVTASAPSALDVHNERLRGAMEDDDHPRPLNIMIAGGPYTADDNLHFEPLQELCAKAQTSFADILILTGPFLDIDHPLISTGDFDLPADLDIDADSATLTTVFRILVAGIFRHLAECVPSITIILVPSVRDVLSKHVSWPQEPLSRKELGLPKQARMVPNPVVLSLNEVTVGISSQDILSELRQSEVLGKAPKTSNILSRLPRHLIEQRHFFPLFPPVGRKKPSNTIDDGHLPTGAMLDTSYLKLGEWLIRPDILITPSTLPPFAKVVESVLVINPGRLSKSKSPGTYAQLTLYPAQISEEERSEGNVLGHKVFERGRVDIIKI